LNELRFGYTRRAIDRQATQVDSIPSDSLNLPGIPINGAFENTLPTFSIAGLQQLGPSANTASNFRTDVTQIFDAVSMQHPHIIMRGVFILGDYPALTLAYQLIEIKRSLKRGQKGIADAIAGFGFGG
jgi:hypothetical protein